MKQLALDLDRANPEQDPEQDPELWRCPTCKSGWVAWPGARHPVICPRCLERLEAALEWMGLGVKKRSPLGTRKPEGADDSSTKKSPMRGGVKNMTTL